MKVPLLDLKAQYAPIRDAVREAIDRVCDSGRFVLGPEVEALEREVAAYCGVRHAVGVSSGTDALLVALMALDVGPGDDVVTTPYSFFATAGVVARLGARPVFADIRPDTFNLDPDAAVSRLTPKTKAVLPVHLYGRCADTASLAGAARARGIPVIEDAAQALGSVDAAGRKAGTLGAAACFSFFPTKNLGGFGDGGMVVTDDDALAKRIRRLRVHGAEPKYYHKEVGGNFRLDALQAAILRVKLPHLDGWAKGRRANAARYGELFAKAGLSGEVTLPGDEPGHVYNQYVVRCRDRDRLRAHLTAEGIGTEVYYPVPLHLQECFRSGDFPEGSLPAAEAAAKESLALPVYPELAPEQLERVVGAIRDFYRATSR